MSPKQGPPTTQTTATGSGFEPNEMVDLAAGSRRLATVRADAQGDFTQSARVPSAAKPGAYRLTATGETSGEEATTTFYVNTNWSQAEFDAARTGFNPHENVLNSQDVAGLTLSWSQAGPYGAPSFTNGMLYATQDDDLVAIHSSSGRVLWKATMGGGFDSTNSTPAVSDGIVYAGDVNSLHAFDARTGAPLWTFSGCGSVGGSGIDVDDGVVYVGGISGLCAVDARTGVQLWRYLGQGDWSFGDPSVGDGMVFAGSEDGVYAVDALTGELAWHVGEPTDFSNSLPIVAGNLVYFDAEYNYHGGGSTGAVAYQVRTGRIAWQYHQLQSQGAFGGGMALSGGTLYVSSASGVIGKYGSDLLRLRRLDRRDPLEVTCRGVANGSGRCQRGRLRGRPGTGPAGDTLGGGRDDGQSPLAGERGHGTVLRPANRGGWDPLRLRLRSLCVPAAEGPGAVNAIFHGCDTTPIPLKGIDDENRIEFVKNLAQRDFGWTSGDQYYDCEVPGSEHAIAYAEDGSYCDGASGQDVLATTMQFFDFWVSGSG